MLVFLVNSKFIPQLRHEYHNGLLQGHSGVFKTVKCLSRAVYWRGMRKFAQQLVATCSICQQNKTPALSPVGLLQPLPILDKVWEDIYGFSIPHLDEFDCLMVVVDRLTKYAHFIPLKHPFTAPTVAVTFVKEVVRLHGFSRSIVLDRAKVFLSHF